MAMANWTAQNSFSLQGHDRGWVGSQVVQAWDVADVVASPVARVPPVVRSDLVARKVRAAPRVRRRNARGVRMQNKERVDHPIARILRAVGRRPVVLTFRQEGGPGGRSWDDETARTLPRVAFRSVETDTQLFHC